MQGGQHVRGGSHTSPVTQCNDSIGVLALPDTRLIAVVGQWDWAAGLTGQALVIARYFLGPEMHLGENQGGMGEVRSNLVSLSQRAKTNSERGAGICAQSLILFLAQGAARHREDLSK